MNSPLDTTLIGAACLTRHFSRCFVNLICLLLLVTGSFAAERSPNIVFILADDLVYGDLGAYGNALLRTPNLDALARAGARFTNFYAAESTCSASRAGLLTGRYALRSGMNFPLLAAQAPWLGVTVSTVKSPGRKSSSVTPFALAGPSFVTSSVYVVPIARSSPNPAGPYAQYP